jgi:tetratricopeptide (TPR) repeat protein
MKEVLRLLKAEQETERSFVAEVEGKADPLEGWSPAMMFFHVAQWRDKLWNGLAGASEGRPVNPPQGDINELNDSEMAGAAGVSLADAAARSDAALTSLIAMFETMGDMPFNWYSAETTSEALVRNSYIHPRMHLADQLLRQGEVARSQRVLEESAAEMRRAEAPGHILGAALYNLAAVRARQDRVEEALALLEEGLLMRPDLKADAAENPDLASLRNLPRFRSLTAP